MTHVSFKNLLIINTNFNNYRSFRYVLYSPVSFPLETENGFYTILHINESRSVGEVFVYVMTTELYEKKGD